MCGVAGINREQRLEQSVQHRSAALPCRNSTQCKGQHSWWVFLPGSVCSVFQCLGYVWHVCLWSNVETFSIVLAAFDLRIMCGSSPKNGFFPVAIYARRARRALPEQLVAGRSSWDILGTNLSVKVRLSGLCKAKHRGLTFTISTALLLMVLVAGTVGRWQLDLTDGAFAHHGRP